ncbi:dihydrofolate reductase family protein [Chamaesiphon sp. OTE_20_metabat_361]|uniref:dihydrofolate reductase family protein n=1 Tax=Chamaesiphon sp. OTE_20_metabat_361 TaxID=2964689 RepID=UPI00286BDF8D|nr:dihydrofolate reductase family protein [Chamaesiphon sp. OTE_20_metabat_361]
MRKLKLQMQITIDGFVAGANGEMDWMVFDWDDEMKNYVNEITEPVDCIILGRKLAQGFIPSWTSRIANLETADAFAHKMVDTPKIVFSKTLEKAEWENTKLAKGNTMQEIAQLKKQSGKDIIVYGGGSFVSFLIMERLIDEYNLFVNPVALGKGMTIFNDLENKLNLTLVKNKAFDCGIILLCYEPKR